MKILRYLMMAALILGISHAAYGFSWNLQDPSNPLQGVPVVDIEPGVPISFDFTTGCNFDGVHYTGCAQLFNDSHDAITSLTFTFSNSGGLDGAPVTCTSDSFTPVVCGLNSNDTQYVLTFDASSSSSPAFSPESLLWDQNRWNGCNPGDYIYIFENADVSNFPSVDTVANAPEPSSIWLALSGMGSLGYLVRRRRKFDDC